MTDALSNTTLFERDALGRATLQTFADTTAIGFGFDAASNLTSLAPPAVRSNFLAHRWARAQRPALLDEVGDEVRQAVDGLRNLRERVRAVLVDGLDPGGDRCRARARSAGFPAPPPPVGFPS